MDDIVKTDGKMESWMIKDLAIGAVLGALVGLGGAYLMIRKAERTGDHVSITSGDALRMGVLIFGLLRSVSDLGTKEQ